MTVNPVTTSDFGSFTIFSAFATLVVIGIVSQVAIQVIFNILVVTDTIPNTGISLPFISYGGSATFFLLGEIGLCLGVARGIHMRDL